MGASQLFPVFFLHLDAAFEQLVGPQVSRGAFLGSGRCVRIYKNTGTKTKTRNSGLARADVSGRTGASPEEGTDTRTQVRNQKIFRSIYVSLNTKYFCTLTGG